MTCGPCDQSKAIAHKAFVLFCWNKGFTTWVFSRLLVEESDIVVRLIALEICALNVFLKNHNVLL